VATAELLGDYIAIAKNPHVATIVAAILAYILIQTGGWLHVWQLFGGANQLMAGLALLLVTLFLVSKAKSYAFALYPMIFMYVTTVAALIYKAVTLLGKVLSAEPGPKVVGNTIAGVIAVVLVICALILAYDGYKAFRKYRTEKVAGAEAQA